MAKTVVANPDTCNVTRILVPLNKIKDNPFNVRSYFKPEAVADLAASIKQNGLLQVPDARFTDEGVYELAYGHMRFRAFKKLNEQKVAGFDKMPLNIRTDLTDADMFFYSIEENLKRTDVKPLEVARCVDNYFTVFPDVTETEVGTKLNLEQSTIANYRRVLCLPKDILDKINEGKISFTQGRELLVLAGLKSPKGDDVAMMKAAVSGLATESKSYGCPNTVEGLKKSIDSTAANYFKFLCGDCSSSYWDKPLWNHKEGDCVNCQKKLKTWENKSASHTWCTDADCWEGKQKACKAKLAAEAKKKMAEEAALRVAASEKARKEREAAEAAAKVDEKPAPKTELVHSIVETTNPKAKKVDDKVDEIPAEKSTPTEPIPQGIPTDEEMAAFIEAHKYLKDMPCVECLNLLHCDRTTHYCHNDGKQVCENLVTRKTLDKLAKRATVDLPPGVMDMVKGEMGTRAEVLDLKELKCGSYGSDLKSGYIQLDAGDNNYNYRNREDLEPAFLGDRNYTVFDALDDPAECMERCTKGFHFAFDSTPPPSYKTQADIDREPKLRYVCSDPKCCAAKKGIKTRAKNAEGLARKRAEMAAIKEAAELAPNFQMASLGLVWTFILEKMERYYGGELPAGRVWLLKRLGLEKWDAEAIRKALAKYTTPEELLRPMVGLLLMEFTDTGDVKNYKIHTRNALSSFGVKIEIEKVKPKGDSENVKETSEPPVPVHG